MLPKPFLKLNPSSTLEPIPTSSPEPTLRLKNDVEGAPREVAQAHVRWLLEWLRKDFSDDEIWSKDAEVEYGAMCSAHGIPARPWNPVAKALADLIRDRRRPRKTYRWILDRHETLRRQRVFFIPGPPRTAG